MVRSFTMFILFSTLLILSGGCATIWNGEPTSRTVLATALAKRIDNGNFVLTREVGEVIRSIEGNYTTEEHRITAPTNSVIGIYNSSYGSGSSSFSARQIDEEAARMARARLREKGL